MAECSTYMHVFPHFLTSLQAHMLRCFLVSFFSNGEKKELLGKICAETYAAVVAEALIRLRNPIFDPPFKPSRVTHPHNTSSHTPEIPLHVPESVSAVIDLKRV